jgi:hypothetical protein
VLLQASVRKSAGGAAGAVGFCNCTGPGWTGTAVRFVAVEVAGPVVAHSRASASVKNSACVSLAVPPMATWARSLCLVDFGARWISGASIRQAFIL